MLGGGAAICATSISGVVTDNILAVIQNFDHTFDVNDLVDTSITVATLPDIS